MMAELRHQAEAQLRKQRRKEKSKVTDQSPADAERTLHELQVHQIELEMQNEELKEARDWMEGLAEKYTDLYDFAPVGYFSLDEKGVIREVNLTGAAMLGVERVRLADGRFSRFVAPSSQPDFLAFLKCVFAGTGPEVSDLAMVKEDGTKTWARLRGTAALSAREARKWCRVSVMDITALKQADEKLRASERETKRQRDYAEATLRTAPIPLLVLEDNLRVHTANEAFYQNFQVAPAESEGQWIYDLGNRQWNIPKLRELLEEILPKNNFFNGFEVTHEFETIGRRTMLLNARRMENEAGQPRRIVLAIEDITVRKQAEEVQSRLGAIVSSADDGILSKTLDGVVTTWNAGAERLFGYTAEEIIGNPSLHLTPPDLLHEEEHILEQILAGKAVEHFETQRITKDGRRLQVSLTISPIMDAAGKVVGASKIVRDITERKKAEEALRASEERFRVAALAVSDLIWTNNAQGRMEGEQPGWAQFTGQTLKEYQGYGWARAVHPDDAQPTIKAWKAAVAEKRLFEFEHRVRRHDGAWRSCSVRAVPVIGGDGQIREWVGVHNDITERKMAEETLRESEARFRVMADAIAQLAWQAQPDGFITWYNQRWYDYTGTTPKQMEGWGWQKVHDPKVLPKVLKRWKASIATGKPFDMAFPLRGAKGGFRQFLTRAVPQKDQRGRVLQWFGTSTDVDDQQRAAETQRRVAVLAASNQKLEAEIVRRRVVEKSLQQSEVVQRLLLEQSQDMQLQLRHLSHQILSAQEEERKKISRELHDEIAQTLAGINLRLGALKRAAGGRGQGFQAKINRTQRLVEKSVDIVHRFARDLRPTLLDDLGLIPALHAFVKNFTQDTGLRVQLTVFAGVEKLDNDKRTVLYRVAQEALTNVARHSQSTTVEMHIQKVANDIVMTIQDNGQCSTMDLMLPAKRGRRLGLIGMRERLEMVGGKFEIHSVKGQGTTVRGEIPFRAVRGGAETPLKKFVHVNS